MTLFLLRTVCSCSLTPLLTACEVRQRIITYESLKVHLVSCLAWCWGEAVCHSERLAGRPFRFKRLKQLLLASLPSCDTNFTSIDLVIPSQSRLCSSFSSRSCGFYWNLSAGRTHHHVLSLRGPNLDETNRRSLDKYGDETNHSCAARGSLLDISFSSFAFLLVYSPSKK